jgi:molybdopterin synthase sulfur carrier subunit
MKIKLHTILTFKEILGARETEISLPEETTIQGLLSRMKELWSERLPFYLFQQGTDRLLPHITLMVNGRSIQFLNGMETILQDGDEVLLVPPVAGG